MSSTIRRYLIWSWHYYVPMLESAEISLICQVRVRGQWVRLIVNQCQIDDWRWKVCLSNDTDTIDEGAIQSRLAAQVASQRAFEAWLHRVHQERFADLRYRWTERSADLTRLVP
jgi:hypothetical protein